MTELIGDICKPSDLTIPNNAVSGMQPSVTGQIVMSGANLVFYDGSAVKIITAT